MMIRLERSLERSRPATTSKKEAGAATEMLIRFMCSGGGT